MSINYNKQNKKIENLKEKIKTLEKEKNRLSSELQSWINLKHETAKLNSSILGLSEELNSLATKLNENNKRENSELKKFLICLTQ
ncbi:hypothetical protein ACFGXM_04265 [Pasteurella multocida]